MLARMGDTVMVNRFGWMMIRGITLEMAGLGVRRGGEGVHQCFHLVFTPQTTVVQCFEAFPPLKMPLFSHQQVSWWLVPPRDYFGKFM